MPNYKTQNLAKAVAMIQAAGFWTDVDLRRKAVSGSRMHRLEFTWTPDSRWLLVPGVGGVHLAPGKGTAWMLDHLDAIACRLVEYVDPTLKESDRAELMSALEELGVVADDLYRLNTSDRAAEDYRVWRLVEYGY